MSKQDLMLRPFQNSDYEAYKWVHDHQLPSVNEFDEGYFFSETITPRFFQTMVTMHESLREDQDAYIYGAFNELNQLVGIIELITISDDYRKAEVKLRVFNLYFNQGYGKAMIKKIFNEAQSIGYTHLVAHCPLHHNVAHQLFISCGFKDEGAQLVQECDQICWPTKRVFSILL